VGIPDSEVARIFEPFFTTKPAGSGTGLGMSMVNDIIIAHKGELKISSEKDTFTEVKINLPLS
jgi:signal transduction histidine kinase